MGKHRSLKSRSLFFSKRCRQREISLPLNRFASLKGYLHFVLRTMPANHNNHINHSPILNCRPSGRQHCYSGSQARRYCGALFLGRRKQNFRRTESAFRLYNGELNSVPTATDKRYRPLPIISTDRYR